MSVHISSAVWKKSQHRGTNLLMMLALADMANDEGVCWPSQTTLAKRARIANRTVQSTLQKLAESGEITIGVHDGPHHVNRYHINLAALGKTLRQDDATTLPVEEDGFEDDEPAEIDGLNPQPTTGRNVNDPSLLSDESNSASVDQQNPYLMWTAFCQGMGIETTALPRPELAKQLAVGKRMLQNGITPLQVKDVAQWLSGDPWWRNKGITMFDIEKQHARWVLAGRPAQRIEITGREKHISGSTPRG